MHTAHFYFVTSRSPAPPNLLSFPQLFSLLTPCLLQAPPHPQSLSCLPLSMPYRDENAELGSSSLFYPSSSEHFTGPQDWQGSSSGWPCPRDRVPALGIRHQPAGQGRLNHRGCFWERLKALRSLSCQETVSHM